MAGSAANAGGLSTRHQTSLQFINDGGHTEYTRMGASYSISGTNVSTSHTVGTADPVTGGLGVQSYAATGVATPGTITAAQGGTNGSGSFSFSQSFTQADIAGTDSTYQDFGNVTTHTGGSTGSAAPGTITAAQGGTNGSGSFSFSQSFTQADIAGTESQYADFGNVTVHTGGSTGTAAPGTITNAHVTTLSGTNLAGSSATSQFVSEITAF